MRYNTVFGIFVNMLLYLLSSTYSYALAHKDFTSSYLVILHHGAAHDSINVNFSEAGTGSQREWGSQQGKRFNFVNIPYIPGSIIEVIKKNSSATTGTLYPKSYRLGKIKANLANGSSSLSVRPKNAHKLLVSFDDDPDDHNLLAIFLNKKETYTRSPVKSDNIYFPSDSFSLQSIPHSYSTVHFANGTFNIGRWLVPKHIKSVILSPETTIVGYIRCDRRDTDPSFRLSGLGRITNSGYPYHYPSTKDIYEYESNENWYKPIEINGGKGHVIEDITIVEPTSYAITLKAHNSTVRNVKIHGFRMNNDAITIVGNNTVVDDCFVRVNDDAIVPYGNDLVVKNSIFWQLPSGSIFQLGWTPHSMKNITISNCDIVNAEWTLNYGNIGFINAMLMRRTEKRSVIEDLHVSDIRFDRPIKRFIDIQPNRQVRRNEPDIAETEPWIFKNCSFKRISFNQVLPATPLFIFNGYSPEHMSSQILFEDIYVKGKKISLDDPKYRSLVNFKNIKGLDVN